MLDDTKVYILLMPAKQNICVWLFVSGHQTIRVDLGMKPAIAVVSPHGAPTTCRTHMSIGMEYILTRMRIQHSAQLFTEGKVN